MGRMEIGFGNKSSGVMERDSARREMDSQFWKKVHTLKCMQTEGN
jgi:hypothetical protein